MFNVGGAKSKYAKIKKSCKLKRCVPTLIILSANGRASAPKVEKKAKKVEIFQCFGDFFKIRSPKVECLSLFDASNKT
jgi:hypothetical protein